MLRTEAMLKVPITFNGHPLGTGDLVNTGGFIASSGNTLATVATTGNYADLLSKPTNLSQFTNDLASSGGGGGAPQVNADWSATSGIAQILNQPTKLSQFTNDLTTAAADWTVQGVLHVQGTATANAGVNIPGIQTLNFGSDAFKEQNAGKIGYQTFSQALDIVGAGEDGDIRLVKIWDDLTVPGNITAGNNVSCALVSADNVDVGDLATQNFLCTQNFTAQGDITVGNNIFCAGIHADHVVCNMDSSFPSIYVDRVGGGLVDVQRVRCDSADAGDLTAESVTARGAITAGNGVTITSGDLNVPTGELRAGSLYARGGVYAVINSTFASFLHVNQGVTTNGTMNFGRDVTKEQNAGIIGYQVATSGALDIYGAGTAVGSRGVKLWDNVTVPGTLAVTGPANTGALTASSVSTPSLTVAGSQVYAQVNADFNATSGVAQILNKPTSNPLCQTFALSGPWPSSGTAGTNTVTFKGGYQVWTGSIDCYATAVGLVSMVWYVNGTNVSSSKMYFNVANCYEALPTVTWVTTLAAGTYTWYPQHAPTGVGASEASASAYVSITEYTLSVAASQVNTDWNATSGLAQILNKPTKLSQFTNDLTGSAAGWAVSGTLTAVGITNSGNQSIAGTLAMTGLATTSAGISVVGNKTVNFGSDQSKATNAGNIGYQLTTSGALDVYGGGTTVGSRVVKLWDNVTVSNSLTVGGYLYLSGTITCAKVVPWTAITCQGYFTPFGSGYTAPQYCVDELGYVRLRGLGSFGNNTGSSTMFTLPAGARPPGAGIIVVTSVYDSVAGIQKAYEFRISQAGAANFGSSNLTVGYVSLDNIVFSTS